MPYMGADEADLQPVRQLIAEHSTPIVLKTGERFTIPPNKQAFFAVTPTIEAGAVVHVGKGAALVQVS